MNKLEKHYKHACVITEIGKKHIERRTERACKHAKACQNTDNAYKQIGDMKAKLNFSAFNHKTFTLSNPSARCEEARALYEKAVCQDMFHKVPKPRGSHVRNGGRCHCQAHKAFRHGKPQALRRL